MRHRTVPKRFPDSQSRLPASCNTRGQQPIAHQLAHYLRVTQLHHTHSSSELPLNVTPHRCPSAGRPYPRQRAEQQRKQSKRPNQQTQANKGRRLPKFPHEPTRPDTSLWYAGNRDLIRIRRSTKGNLLLRECAVLRLRGIAPTRIDSRCVERSWCVDVE
jgi:hypothetical protein